MRSPTIALLWEIARRRKGLLWTIVALAVAGSLVELAGHAGPSNDGRSPLTVLLGMNSFLALLGVFNYTESGDRTFGRFPSRLFTLPVSSLRLVAVPMVAGIVAIDLLYLVWQGRFDSSGTTSPLFIAVLLAASMVFYQAALWTLAWLGTLRLVVLGVLAAVVIAIGFLPSWPGDPSSPWHSETALGLFVASAAAVAFLAAWWHVARTRAGGGARLRRRALPSNERAAASPRVHARPFPTPASAQLWFEWRSSGTPLPLVVGGLLLVAILPASWLMRDDAGRTFMLLLATLATPVMLAIPIGIAFSKPSFWSNELSVPAFVAVRPLSAQELVTIKVKVAALSAAAAWLLVLAFLAVWLPSWANLDSLSVLASQWWAFHGRSALAVYAMAALIVSAGALLTWRFLVTPLWNGLSGGRRLYVWSAMSPLSIAIAGTLLVTYQLPAWLLEDPANMLPFVWGAALAVASKYWLAAYAWRGAAPRWVRQYFVAWCVGTLAFVALALALWSVLHIYLSVDVHRLQSLLVLGALLAMPAARLGLAPGRLAANRHGA